MEAIRDSMEEEGTDRVGTEMWLYWSSTDSHLAHSSFSVSSSYDIEAPPPFLNFRPPHHHPSRH